MRVTQQGFTFLKLLFVVAIVGILASMVIPAYCDYIGKAKTTEAIVSLAKVKKYIAEQETINQPLDELVDASFIESVSWHPKHASLLIALSSNITLFNKKDGKYLVFTLKKEDEKITWQCYNQHLLIIDNAVSNLDLPVSCRS